MQNKKLKIKVIGIGGGGQKIADYLYQYNKCKNMEFIAINSDEQILNLAKIENKILIKKEYSLYDKVVAMFPKLVLKFMRFEWLVYKIYKMINHKKSFGCGGNPRTGEEYAFRYINKIREIVGTPDIVFIISSFGGGCGTGATPVIAKMLKDTNINVFAIVTLPFEFEGRYRMQQATDGVLELERYVKNVIVFDNQAVLKGDDVKKDTSIKNVFNYINEKISENFYEVIKEKICKI